MKKLFIIFAVLITFKFSFSQVYPPVNSSHPKIVISGNRFDWLRNHHNDPQVLQIYSQFLYNYNNYWITTSYTKLSGSDSLQWNYIFRRYTEAEGTYRNDMVWTGLFSAFLWKVNGDSLMLKRSKYVITRLVYSIYHYPYDSLNSSERECVYRDYGQMASMFLDWCYDDIPLEMKISLGQALFKINRDFVSYFITSSAGNSYVSSHNAYNSVLTMQNTLALYNASGISPPQQDSIDNWYHILYDKWMNNFLPVYGYYRGTNGGWNWGAAYSFWSLIDQYTLFDNLLFSTGKNLYTDLTWVSNSINQYWYMCRPDNYSLHLGDGIMKVIGDNAVYRHSAVFNDLRSNWLSQVFGVPSYADWTMPKFYQLAFREFNQMPSTQPELPADWFSDKVGLVTSRTTWDTNAVQVWMFNSLSKKASHEHRDNLTFGIYHKKPLVVDAGHYDSYGSAHFKNYYTRSVAHNIISIFDTTEVYYYGGEIVSNDGGQIESPTLMNYNNIFEPNFQRGRWLSYYSGNNLLYCANDGKLSYSSVKVKKITRRLLFIKPDIVVIYDNLVLNSHPTNTYKPRWNIHFQNIPAMSGQIVFSEVPNHIEHFSGKEFYTSNGRGNLYFRNLIPDSTRLVRIGGTGYEYWVNGVNYPPSTSPDTNYTEAGKWRIELRPVFDTDTVVFLNTIKIGNNYNPAQPAGYKIKNEITTGVDFDSVICIFDSKGDTGVIYHKFYAGGGRNVKLFASDIRKNMNAFLYLDNVKIKSLKSDSNGVIVTQFNIPSGTNHFIEIKDSASVSVKTGENIPSVFFLSQNYPNPFNPDTKILFGLKTASFVSIKIYDLLGREIYTLVNENFKSGEYSVIFSVKELFSNSLSSGLYFYRISVKDLNGNISFTDVKKMLLIK